MKEHIIPYLLSDDQWWCGLNICNLGATPATVKIEYFNSEDGTKIKTEEISLGGHCSARFLSSIPYGSAIATSEGNIAVSEFFGEIGGSTMYSPVEWRLVGPEPPVVPPVIPPAPPVKPPAEPPIALPVIPPMPDGKLTWAKDRTTAVAAAKSQGKKIILLAGRETCPTTTGMRDIACESPRINSATHLPEPLDPLIKRLIWERFIPWFIDIDRIPDDTQLYTWYRPGDGKDYFLPMIAVIDPANPQTYVDRSYGNQNFKTLYDWLLKYS